MIVIRIASYSSAELPLRTPRTAEITAAMIRMITSASTNWERRILTRETLVSWTRACGPCFAIWAAASAGVRPSMPLPRRSRTAWADCACQSSGTAAGPNPRLYKTASWEPQFAGLAARSARHAPFVKTRSRPATATICTVLQNLAAGWEKRKQSQSRQRRRWTPEDPDVSETTALMFQIGVIMLIAFMGAAIASRFRLSVIIGYILAGILIGPHVQLAVAGVSYQGIITDSAFIQDLSRIGLILLLFFVGLQFSIEKLKKTKQAAVVLAVVNLGVGMFCGFVLGTYLGWPFIDTIFMAGVVSMSSSAITAKALIEL